MFYVYLLLSTNGATYVGATVDIERRLRQHNQEIKGGAQATGIKVQQGETWVRVIHVTNFPNWQAALQFEWRWKQLSRKLPKKMLPLERRIRALNQLIRLPQSTSKAVPYAEWENPPKIVCETTESTEIYEKITNENNK